MYWEDSRTYSSVLFTGIGSGKAAQMARVQQQRQNCASPVKIHWRDVLFGGMSTLRW